MSCTSVHVLPLLLLRLVFSLMLLAVALSSPTGAKAETLELITSAQKAKQVLVNALQGNSGLMAGLRMSSFEVEFTGTDSDYYQSFALTDQTEPESIKLWAKIDLQKNRSHVFIEQSVSGGVVLEVGGIATPERAVRYNAYAGWVTSDPNISSIIQLFAKNTVPAVVIKEALSSPGSLNYVGSAKLSGKQADVIEFTNKAGLRSRLTFETDSGVLRQLQFFAPSTVTGQQLISYRFSGEKTVESVSFPERVELSIGNDRERTIDVKVNVKSINKTFADTDFELPDHYTNIDGQPFLAEYVTDNVILVRNVGNALYRAVFLETPTGLIALDAVISPPAATRIMTAAKQKAGGKPITHIILTHFHVDHIGGLMGYLSDAPKIYGTEDAAKLVERMTASGPSLFSPLGSTGLPEVNVEVVDIDVEFVAGGVPLRLINVGPTPHVRQLLVLYDEREKIILDSDTFAVETAWAPSMSHFAEWVEHAPLEIEQLIGIHHELITKAYLLKRASENTGR